LDGEYGPQDVVGSGVTFWKRSGKVSSATSLQQNPIQ
jgi:hypothetical protein